MGEKISGTFNTADIWYPKWYSLLLLHEDLNKGVFTGKIQKVVLTELCSIAGGTKSTLLPRICSMPYATDLVLRKHKSRLYLLCLGCITTSNREMVSTELWRDTSSHAMQKQGPGTCQGLMRTSKKLRLELGDKWEEGGGAREGKAPQGEEIVCLARIVGLARNVGSDEWAQWNFPQWKCSMILWLQVATKPLTHSWHTNKPRCWFCLSLMSLNLSSHMWLLVVALASTGPVSYDKEAIPLKAMVGPWMLLRRRLAGVELHCEKAIALVTVRITDSESEWADPDRSLLKKSRWRRQGWWW